MATIKNFKKIKYGLTNPKGAGDKVVKVTFSYQNERFSYNVTVPNNPKFKEKDYINAASKQFTTLVNNGELAKYADARIQAKRAGNFTDFNYAVVKSSVAGYAEVRATLKYQGKHVTRYLFIEEVPGKKDDYYINQAKAQIKKEIATNQLPKESKNYLKPKKVSTGGKVAIAVLGVVAVAGAAFATYKFLNPGVNIANYSVTFDTDGGSSIEAQTVEKGKTATKPTANPTKVGYDFDGWYADESCTEAFDFEKTPINKNTIVYADWDAVTHTITFDYNDETRAPTTETVLHDERLEYHGDPGGYEGHTFNGWYKVTDGEIEDEPYNFNTPVIEDFTLKAGWDDVYNTVTYDTNGGTYVEPEDDVIYGGTLDEPTCTYEGHHLLGWYTDSEFTTEFIFNDDPDSRPATEVKSSLTLYAKWEIDVITITFNSGEGSWQGQTSKEIPVDTNYGELPVVPTTPLVYEGHTFTGWSPKIDVATTEGTIYTAQWDINKYTVTYSPNGGSYVAPTTEVAHGSTINSQPTCDYTGHHLLGWYTTPTFDEGTEFTFGEVGTGTPVTSNLTLYAKWELNVITITFNSGDGSWQGQTSKEIPVDTNYGELPVVPTTPLVYEGHTFTGWSPKIDVATTEGTIYTAQWDDEVYSVTVDPNGGKFTDGTTTTKIFDAKYGTTWANFKAEHGSDIVIDPSSYPSGMDSYKYQYYDATSGWTDLTDESTVAINANFSVRVEYVHVPTNFTTDSWETFTDYVNSKSFTEMIAEGEPYRQAYLDQGNTFVGLTRTLTVGNTDYQVRVIGQNTNAGATDAKFTFEFVNTLELDVPYNTNEEQSGYENSYINNHLNNNFYYMLPETVRNSIKDTSISCYGDGGDHLLVKMFVLSASELGFSTSATIPAEGDTYAYYSTGSSKIKYKNGSTDPVDYWTRTSDISGAVGCAWNVNVDGDLGDPSEHKSIAADSSDVYIAPAFAI